MRKVYHVVPYKDKQWAVKIAGHKDFLSIHDSKTDAIDAARRQPGETVVYSPTGVALQAVAVEGVDIAAIRKAVRKVGDRNPHKLVMKRSSKLKQSKKNSVVT